MRYYKITPGDDETWHISVNETFPDGTPLDIWAYRGCQQAVDTRPVPLHIVQHGKRVDYYPTPFLTTIVSKQLADCWARFATSDIQRIPAHISDNCGDWEVIVVLPCIDCIDHTRSKITYHPPNHSEKPGKPRGVLKLVLDPARIGDHHIFHPKDWEVATIVSEKVKQAMEDLGATGAEFWPVTE